MSLQSTFFIKKFKEKFYSKQAMKINQCSMAKIAVVLLYCSYSLSSRVFAAVAFI
ncbi:hypothetical protein DEU39_1109 [Chryseobacterium sp. AG363]|nr:hypothetical protein DEU39_1109 [Chryseobacterium sp. AG363]